MKMHDPHHRERECDRLHDTPRTSSWRTNHEVILNKEVEETKHDHALQKVEDGTNQTNHSNPTLT